MKVSDAIVTLQAIQAKFGDISITGGMMHEDKPPTQIMVTDSHGMEIWPDDASNQAGYEIDGVFIE